MQFQYASVKSVDIMGWPDPVMCLAGSYFSLNDDRQGQSPRPADCPEELRHLTSLGAVSAPSWAAILQPCMALLSLSVILTLGFTFSISFIESIATFGLHYSSWYHFFFFVFDHCSLLFPVNLTHFSLLFYSLLSRSLTLFPNFCSSL